MTITKEAAMEALEALRDHARLDQTMPTSFARLLSFIEQSEAADRDAARYRWLRDHGQHFVHADKSPSPWAVIGTSHSDQHPCSFADLDAAIDAAIQSSKVGESQ